MNDVLLGLGGGQHAAQALLPFCRGSTKLRRANLAKISLLGTMATLMQHFSFRLAYKVISNSPTRPGDRIAAFEAWTGSPAGRVCIVLRSVKGVCVLLQ